MLPPRATAPSLPDEVIAAYSPVLYLHPDDKYLPVSVEWFIERSQLIYFRDCVTGTAEVKDLDLVPGGVVTLVAAGEVTQEKLLELQDGCELPGNLSLTIRPEHYGGCHRDGLHEVPIYVHAKLVVDEAGKPEAYEINYITFYAFNGHYDLPARIPLFRTGQHVGDWEHLTVRLDAASLELQGVWYNAHRNIEGEWCPAAEVPRTPCGRIVGYVAINGHGVYPHCGTIPRLFFMANDHTSRRGPVWNPARLVRLSGLDHGSACCVVGSRGCSLPCAAKRSGPAWYRYLLGGSADGGVFGTRTGYRGEAGGDGVVEQHQQQQQQLPQEHPGVEHTGGDALLQPVDPPPQDGDAAISTPPSDAAAAQSHEQPAATDGTSSPMGELRRQPEEGGTASAGPASSAYPRERWGEAVAGAVTPGCRAPGAVFRLPEVVHDTSPWQRYKGRWGSIVSPPEQRWFWGAEPPVSRGLLRRLFLPCAPGVERLPRSS